MALTKVNSTLVDGAINTDASGNVGIGTASPLSRLHIEGNSSGAVQAFIENANGSTNSSSELVFGIWSGAIPSGTGNPGPSAKISAINTSSSNATADLAFSTYAASGVSAERMRITSAGEVSISNLAAFSSPEGVFTVNGDGCGNYIGAINNRNLSNCNPAHGLIFRAGFNGSASGSNYFSFRRPDNTVTGSITQTGGTTVSFTTSSDYRLKDNINPMTGALDKVSALKPVTYTWKEDGSAGQGFIAHELAEIVPDCVVGEKDAVDFEGNPQYQSIDTSFLVATLTAAIQEQQAIITDLKARIETLEAK